MNYIVTSTFYMIKLELKRKSMIGSIKMSQIDTNLFQSKLSSTCSEDVSPNDIKTSGSKCLYHYFLSKVNNTMNRMTKNPIEQYYSTSHVVSYRHFYFLNDQTWIKEIKEWEVEDWSPSLTQNPKQSYSSTSKPGSKLKFLCSTYSLS